MADTFTFDDLGEILVNRIGLDESDFAGGGGTTLEEIGLDSLALIELQLEVQQRYGFEVPPEDAEEIVTLDDAVTYVNRRLREG